VVLRIRLQSHQVHLTMLQYYTFMQYTVIQKIHTYIHKNESKHSEMGPVRQNPIQRPVRSVHVCALCTVVAHNIAQNRIDSFPPYPPDNHHCSDDVYLREGGTCQQQPFLIYQLTPMKWTSSPLCQLSDARTHW